MARARAAMARTSTSILATSLSPHNAEHWQAADARARLITNTRHAKERAQEQEVGELRAPARQAGARPCRARVSARAPARPTARAPSHSRCEVPQADQFFIMDPYATARVEEWISVLRAWTPGLAEHAVELAEHLVQRHHFSVESIRYGTQPAEGVIAVLDAALGSKPGGICDKLKLGIRFALYSLIRKLGEAPCSARSAASANSPGS
jgi:hypothetical protein